MKNDFEEFMKENTEKILKLSNENSIRNENNEVVIEETDPWFKEDEWDVDMLDVQIM